MAHLDPRKPGYSIEQDSWFIRLTQGVIAFVDPDMVPVLAQHNWYGKLEDDRWYAKRSTGPHCSRVTELMHRAILDAPKGLFVDHRKHYPKELRLIDNRRANLRACDNTQNQHNQRPRLGGSSPFKGVSWIKRNQKWCAAIKIKKRSKHLGYFDCETKAAIAYDDAAKANFGKFAQLNFPDEKVL